MTSKTKFYTSHSQGQSEKRLFLASRGHSGLIPAYGGLLVTLPISPALGPDLEVLPELVQGGHPIINYQPRRLADQNKFEVKNSKTQKFQ